MGKETPSVYSVSLTKWWRVHLNTTEMPGRQLFYSLNTSLLSATHMPSAVVAAGDRRMETACSAFGRSSGTWEMDCYPGGRGIAGQGPDLGIFSLNWDNLPTEKHILCTPFPCTDSWKKVFRVWKKLFKTPSTYHSETVAHLVL